MQPASKIENEHVESAKDTASLHTSPVDAEKERRLVRKLDRTILVWIMTLYLLSYLDRYIVILSQKLAHPSGGANILFIDQEQYRKCP